VRHDLPIDELMGFLERPNVGTLATFRPDGGVLLSPVWYEWRDGGFNVGTGEDDVKVRHLTRDPRATLVVAEQTLPYAGVEVRGTARLIREGGREVARRIAARYSEGSDSEDSVVIRLEPGVLRTWDFADDQES
jgi:PPOX class probable F420-dependent enzyme